MTSRFQISHDISKLTQEKDEVVLTLKDKGILDANSSGSEDELEELETAAVEKAEKNRRRNLHGQKYAGLTELTGGDLEGEVLSKYDDFEEVERKRARVTKISVGKDIIVSGNSKRESDGEEKKISDITSESLSVNGRSYFEPSIKFQSDFVLRVDDQKPTIKQRVRQDYVFQLPSNFVETKRKEDQAEGSKRARRR